MAIPPIPPMPATDSNIRTSDITTNNATTSKHGFVVKATAPTTGVNVVGIANGETEYTNKTIREILTANRTYYVRTDGSDSNTGLVDSAGGAWLTLQNAYNVIRSTLDFGGYAVTVSVGDGTYTSGLTLTTAWLGGGTLSFIGDTATPANTVVSTTSSNAFNVSITLPGTLTLSGFKVETTTSGSGVVHNGSGQLTLGPFDFGACADNQILINTPGAKVVTVSGYTISAGATRHVQINTAAYFQVEGGTVTLTGTPAFTTFLQIIGIGAARFNCTFSGSATGIIYNIGLNGTLDVSATALSNFPGNAAGFVSGDGVVGTLVNYSRNVAQFDKANTTLAAITGLVSTLLAGRTYRFRAILYTTSNVASGVKAAIGGTATATAIIYEAMVYQGGVLVAPGTSRATALATAVANVTAVTVATIIIEGTITVNAAGTLTVQFADNAGTNTSSVLVGSNFEVQDITP